MADIYTKVKHVDYLNLTEHCKSLEKENAMLKAEIKKLSAKNKETETKKGGNK